ncbi:hypothetical protein EJ08DRAFT_698456 [Tothia fuscella]|uniref:Uncharacterized protein n=1 Tax=Tothia fuscella TaxID=1048955 RepID=A0A9P4NPK9_9PEZI|nr:hypothetical protein EJ08DRAFT_698456 [Tothia fuscella]
MNSLNDASSSGPRSRPQQLSPVDSPEWKSLFQGLTILECLGPTQGDYVPPDPSYATVSGIDPLETSQGEYIHPGPSNATSSRDEHVKLQRLYQEYLNGLSILCDFERQGDTVSAVSIEERSKNGEPYYIYWVASNRRRAPKVLSHLRGIFARLRYPERPPPIGVNDEALIDQLANDCICFLYSAGEAVSGTDDSMVEAQSLQELCTLSYKYRLDVGMPHPADIVVGAVIATERDTLHMERAIVYLIQQLGQYHEISRNLLRARTGMPHLFSNYKLQWVTHPTSKWRTPPFPDDVAKTVREILTDIVVRQDTNILMTDKQLNEKGLAKIDKRVKEVLDSLEKWEAKQGASVETKWNNQCVHAELQVLHHFHDSRALPLRFAGPVSGTEQKFIGCSKPACYSCRLYFLYHKPQMEIPGSHVKICLKWRPPTLVKPEIFSPEQQSLLSEMLEAIEELIYQRITGTKAFRGQADEYPFPRWNEQDDDFTAGENTDRSSQETVDAEE